MHLSDLTAAARRGVKVALVAALVSPMVQAGAQELLPRVEVRQVGDLRWAWQNEARVKLDRDAFLVVVELGADGRVRVVYPERPSQSAYTRSNRPLYTPLPSSDALFIRSSWVRVPTVIAFASDVAPDLSSFSSDGKSWEFEYNVADNAGEREVVNAIAEVLYGSLDMPFSIATARSAPVLSASAIGVLASCGYALGGDIANDFRSFLWDAYGPLAIGSRRMFFGDYGSDWHRNLFLSTYMPFPFSSFQRSIGGGLWNRYGAGCPGLNRQAPLFFVASNAGRMPTPPDSAGTDTTGVTPPKDQERLPPKAVDDVKLVPASPAAIEKRTNAVREAVSKVVTSSGDGVAERSARSELVQRSQVAQAIAMINARNALGVDGGNDAANSRRGLVRRAASGGSGGYGGSGTVTRASGSGAGGGSTGVGTSSGSAGSSSAGSGASSGEGRGSEARGGATGGGRTGTGRP